MVHTECVIFCGQQQIKRGQNVANLTLKKGL